MPDFTPDQLLLLEVESAWEAFCDENPHSMARLQQLSSNAGTLIELAFKAGYTSGAGTQLRQIREARTENLHPWGTCGNCGAPLTAEGCSAGCFKRQDRGPKR